MTNVGTWIFRRCICVLSIMACGLSAHGQSALNPRIFSGEYIVSPYRAGLNSARSNSDTLSVLSTSGLSATKNLGNGLFLMTAPQVELSTLSTRSIHKTSVPYDAKKNICPQLIKQKVVATCSPNFEIKINNTPNDPRFSALGNLKQIGAEQAWNVTQGSSDEVVAVVDTGIEYTHPDLSANVWTNPLEIAGNRIDDDNNGYVDDIHGYDFYNDDGDPLDDNGHGTHVSGTIGAVGNNNQGVVGVNWTVKIVAAKFLGADGAGSLSDAIAALTYVTTLKKQGVNIHVINNSWGGGPFSDALFSAIKNVQSAGLIFVAASGNESNDNDASPSYPASYDVDNVVSVAAADADANVASFSNFGETQVDIAAPGVGIVSTYLGGTYASLSGTSMATPHVTGSLALLYSQNKSLVYQDAISRLYRSASLKDQLRGVVAAGKFLNLDRLAHGSFTDIPSSPPPASCTYAIDAIDYSPDPAVPNAPILFQSDEEYKQVALPFAVPFFAEYKNTVNISSNGVIYFGPAPTEIDFKPAARAPRESFAPLQTDLVASKDPEGVRILKRADHTSFYWKMRTYKGAELSNVEVSVTIYPSGILESFVSFTDSDVDSIEGSAVIGLTNVDGSQSQTFAASGSDKIRSGMALRWTPSCSPASQQKVSVTSVKVKSASARKAGPGSKVSVHVTGSGTGSVAIQARLDGYLCPTSASALLINGEGDVRVRVPRGLHKSLTLIIGEKNVRVPSTYLGGKANAKESTKMCQGLFKSIS